MHCSPSSGQGPECLEKQGQGVASESNSLLSPSFESKASILDELVSFFDRSKSHQGGGKVEKKASTGLACRQFCGDIFLITD